MPKKDCKYILMYMIVYCCGVMYMINNHQYEYIRSPLILVLSCFRWYSEDEDSESVEDEEDNL